MDDRATIVDLERRLAELEGTLREKSGIEVALRRSEARLAHALEAGGVGAWELDLVTLDAWRSQQHDRIFGYETGAPEWTYVTFLDHVASEDRSWVDARFQDALAADGCWSFECRIRRADGEIRWIGAQGQVDADGGQHRLMKGTVRDITVRKSAEIALGRSEERFQHVVHATRDIVWDIDLVADRVWWSEALQTELGFPPEQIGPDTAWCFAHIHPDDRQRVINGMKEAAAGTDSVWSDDFRYRRADGAYAHIADRGFITRDPAGRALRMTGAMRDVTARKRAEAVLRASEERQAFLLKLSDLLRPLSDPAKIQHAAMKLLAEQYDVMRAGYLDVHADGDTMTMAAHFERDAVPAPPQIRLSDYGPDLVEAFRAGRTRHVRDTIAEAETEEQRAAYCVLGVRSWIIAPVVKGGRLTAIVGVVSRAPRDWTDTEIQLITDLAERTWDAAQRARSEGALRESEERFAQFARASTVGLWIRNADTLAMEFVSPAIGTIYGVEPDALLGSVERWAAMIVPDDRDLALQHLGEARMGSVAMHEFRIQRPLDGAFRWIRNTDFPLRDDHGRVQRIGGIAEDVTEAKLAAEHSAVLLAELQHRVRNIMALLRSITIRTAERAEDVPEYRDLMMGRLLAFARVQALLTRTANVSVGIISIVHDEVSVQAQHEGQYVLDGPEIALSPKAAEVLTLAIHELATNAVKYGAFSVPDGRVTVNWSIFERRGGPWLSLDWTEEGTPKRPEQASNTPRRRGFGSELIEGRIPYELRGRGQVTIEPGGARCHLEFPLQGGASIMETGAPQRALVFGGAIDMTGEPDLTGRRVLVVEDDYYLATDAARALRGAGAEVVGPCATEEDARAELEEQRPDAVVVDINLGPGPSFKLAETLKDRGIPFVFTTGYDAEVIPEEFEGVERLEKPLQLRQIVGAVARLISAVA